MKIYEIKRQTAKNNPLFFNRETMRFFGQTLRDFSVKKLPDGRYRISAPIRFQGRVVGTTERIFDPETNSLIYPTTGTRLRD